MAKSKAAAAARQAKANALMAFSPRLASLRSQLAWASRHVLDPAVEQMSKHLAEAEILAFTLAQDIESGRVELDLPDEPRPLFERPAKPIVTIPLKTEDLIDVEFEETEPEPPRRLYVRCNTCRWIKFSTDPSPCPNKHTGGFSLCEELAPVELPQPEATRPGIQMPQARPKDSWRSLAILDLECEHDEDGKIAKSAVYASGYTTAGEAWDLIENGKLLGVSSMTKYRAVIFEIALRQFRTKAGDPAPESTEPQTPPAKPARKGPKLRFMVTYNFNDDEEAQRVMLIDAYDWDEARKAMDTEFALGSIVNPAGDRIIIDHDRMQLMEVPRQARNGRKAAAIANA